MPVGLFLSLGAKRTAPALPASVRALFMFLDSTLTRNRSGTGDSITDSGANAILTKTGGLFTSSDVPQYIRMTGWTNSGNNGIFPVIANPGTDQLTYANAAAVTETNAAGQWQTLGRISSLVDRVSGINAVPSSIPSSLCIDNFTLANGKLIGAQISSNFAQNIIGPDVGGLINGLGNADMSLFMYGKRESASVASNVIELSNGGTHVIRASFNSTNQMRMLRNNGTNASTIAATNAAITTTSIFPWCWTYNNAGGGSCEAFRDAVSLGAPVTPGSAQRPVDLNQVLLGSLNTLEGGSFLAMAVFNTQASIADQTALKAYVDFHYA